jgi:site-specific DNA recombinase
MRAVIYSRVSTDAQERDGTSLDTQERACLEHTQANNWRVIDCVRDTASGFTLDRDGIERVRQFLRSGVADVVVAYAVDRLSRNQNHIGVLFDEVEQAGAQLEFVTERFEDTAIGRFILAARAFIAEVEREKIVERTTRGKIERARSGRLPQATGKGIYGYRYNRETGKREIEAYQAAVVRRVFQRYAENRSFSAVSNELNEAGVPSFSGGRWYPLTVRSVLTNENYTGRTIFRRTKRVKSRKGANGKRRSLVVERPVEEWIEIEGATPRIVDDTLWERVQEIIRDPERIRRRPAGRFYALSTRARCGVCGSAMVGQTLTVKGRPYRYYRCRHAYDRNTGHECSARYVRADALETAVWREVKRVLTEPDIVLRELRRATNGHRNGDEASSLEQEIASLKEREKRLVRLYTYGELGEDIIREEGASIRRQVEVLEERLNHLSQPPVDYDGCVSVEALERVCAAVAQWLDRANEEERTMALEALQLAVVATKNSATVTGELPVEAPEFITIAQTWA